MKFKDFAGQTATRSDLTLASDHLLEANPCEGPVAVHRSQRDLQHLRHFGHGQTNEIAKLYHLGRNRVVRRELIERVADREDFLAGRTDRDSQSGFLQWLKLDLTATLETALSPGCFHQDAPHGLAGGSEEVCAVLPLGLLVSSQPQPRFVDEGGGLESLAGRLGGHLQGREPAQFIIDEREQFPGGLRITTLNAIENARDVTHDSHSNGGCVECRN